MHQLASVWAVSYISDIYLQSVQGCLDMQQPPQQMNLSAYEE